MTVSTNTNKKQALGNGINKTFPYDFRIYSATELEVVSTDLDTAVDTTLALNTDYTVTGAGSYNGGNVVLSGSAPSSTTRITIRRVIPVTQSTDLRNQGAYFAETHEDVFDKLTMIDQQQQEEIERSLRLPASASGASTELPVPSASKVIGWNTAGTALTNYGAVDNTLLAVQLAASGGSAMIGHNSSTLDQVLNSGVAKVVASIASLKAIDKTTCAQAYATGYYAAGDGGGGLYYYDASDTASADNGGTIIVATDGGRWKLVNTDYVTINQFGAATTLPNNGPKIQAALDWAAGRPIYALAGTYICTTAITYDTTGDGNVEAPKLIGAGNFKTLFDNRTGGVLFTFTSGNSASDWQNNIRLEHFGVTNSTSVAGTVGIKMVGIRYGRVAPRVVDQASHGLWLDSAVGDATDCMNIDFVDGDYYDNGGWGIYVDADTGIHANLNFENNRLILNTSGGIYASSVVSCKFHRNAYAYNGGPGLTITKPAAGNFSKNITVSVEEWDSNHGTQIVLDGVVDVTIEHPYMLANAGLPTVLTKGISIANSINVTVNKAIPRIAPGLTGITLFDIASTASYTRILDPEYSSWEATGNTKYADASATTNIIESHEYLRGIRFPSTQVSSTGANVLDDYEEGTWTPTDGSGAGLALSGASGSYTKIGRLVTLTGQFTMPATANGNNISIGGVPFQAANNAAAGILQSSANAGDSCLIATGTSALLIYGASLNRRTNANYSGVTVYFTLSYQTAT